VEGGSVVGREGVHGGEIGVADLSFFFFLKEQEGPKPLLIKLY
jgi:hypothetical protein